MTTPDQPSAVTAHESAPGAIQRLEAVLHEEIEALRRHDFSGLAAFTDRKARCLLELTRGRAAEGISEDRARLRSRLVATKWALLESERLLALHLRATNHVAGLLARELAVGQADGTYTMSSCRSGTEP